MTNNNPLVEACFITPQATLFEEIQFEECCHKTFKNINNTMELGKALKKVLITGAVIGVTAPKVTQQILNAVFNNWGSFAQALKEANSSIQSDILISINYEILKHDSRRTAQEQKLHNFWQSFLNCVQSVIYNNN